MYPCDPYGRRAPGLYTYYAIMSLVVVVLAISLIWFPVVQLITEINTIITKVVIYFNVEFLGYTNVRLFHAIEVLLISQQSLVMISFFCMSYALYLASNDFLSFVGCYICNLPNIKQLDKAKQLGLAVIEYLLNLTGNQGGSTESKNVLKRNENHLTSYFECKNVNHD